MRYPDLSAYLMPPPLLDGGVDLEIQRNRLSLVHSDAPLKLLWVQATPTDSGRWAMTMFFNRPAWGVFHLGTDSSFIAPNDITFWSSEGRVRAPLYLSDLTCGRVSEQVNGTLTFTGSASAQPGASFFIRLPKVSALDPSASEAVFQLPFQTENDQVPLRNDSIDYLNKDYESFRQLLMSRLNLDNPNWSDDSPADMGGMLAEVLAYAGDYLSYYQDAVATEAYLKTARLRVSLRRHARLLDYRIGEGGTSRVWVQLKVQKAVTLPSGTRFWSRNETAGTTDRIAASNLDIIYEAVSEHLLVTELNSLRIWDGNVDYFVLYRGTTSVEVAAPKHANITKHLRPGIDVLLSSSLDTQCSLNHVVRVQSVRLSGLSPSGEQLIVIEWQADDALPFDLTVTDRVNGIVDHGLAFLSGNLVLSEFGSTTTSVLPPPDSNPTRAYRPSLPNAPLVWSEDPKLGDMEASARSQTVINPITALPCIKLIEMPLGFDDAHRPSPLSFHTPKIWSPRYDLLDCGPFDRCFVVEKDNQGQTSLRFGDGRLGSKPTSGATMVAIYRLGNTSAASVGPNSLKNFKAPSQIDQTLLSDAIITISNPLPANAVTLPQSMGDIRQNAPVAHRIQQSCAKIGDYAAAAKKVEGVFDAVAGLEERARWPIVVVHVRNRMNASLTQDLIRKVEEHLAQRRLAGRDIVVLGPILVPLSITLEITIIKNKGAQEIKEAVRQALLGPKGLFDPRSLTFGQVIYSSKILTAVTKVQGVLGGILTTLHRTGNHKKPSSPPSMLALAFNEIARLDDDPALPANGLLTLTIRIAES